jgi:hypothetical protein
MLHSLDIDFFKDNGYVVLSDMVPQTARFAALGLIEKTLEGVGGPPKSLEGAKPWVRAKSKLQQNRSVLDLLGHANGVLRQFLPDPVLPSSCQIASRFPNENTHDSMGAWHIDNFTPKDMARKSRPSEFDCLVGVVLTDMGDRDRGNLGVWPGGHLTMSEYVHRFGCARLEQDGLVHAVETVPSIGGGGGSSQAWPVLARPGDIVLAHRMLPHTVLENKSPHTRHVVYFRVSSGAPRAANFSLSDLWSRWGPKFQQPSLRQTEWSENLHWLRRGRTIETGPHRAHFRCKTSLSEPNRFASAVTVDIMLNDRGSVRYMHVHTNGALSPEMHKYLSTHLQKRWADTNCTSSFLDKFSVWVTNEIWSWDFQTLVEMKIPTPAPPPRDNVSAWKPAWFEATFRKFHPGSSKARMLLNWKTRLGCTMVLWRDNTCGFRAEGPAMALCCLLKRMLLFNWKGVLVKSGNMDGVDSTIRQGRESDRL